MPRSSQNRSASRIASHHRRVVEVQVRLVGEEPVPEVLLAHRVEGPVGRLGVDEDDPGVRVAGVVVGPDVEVAVRAVRVVAAMAWNHGCWSEVWFMTKSMITRMPRSWAASRKSREVVDGAELGQHVGVVGDVVAAVAQRGREERRQPEAVHAQPLQVVQPSRRPSQVAGAVAVGVGEAADQHLVEHRALEPFRVSGGRHGLVQLGLHCPARSSFVSVGAVACSVLSALRRSVGPVATGTESATSV